MRLLSTAALFVLISHGTQVPGAASRPAFDAAVIKTSPHSGSPNIGTDFKPGHFELRNITVRDAIVMAFKVRYVTGGPAWVESTRYDILAKSGLVSYETRLEMLQTLLLDRFRLSVHLEQRMEPAYALVIAKGGQRLSPSTQRDPDEPACKAGRGSPGHSHQLCRSTMQELAGLLPRLSPSVIDLPVVDQTSLSGSFEFQLDWSMYSHPSVVGYTPPPSGESAAVPTTILDALNQVGLRLERRKLPLPQLVIDRIEHPSEN